mmetsp:Transcript_70332/g.194564  ORF Transcript_70332/g.194564 Transcript_70332/m.194564 type:complete len:262 (-) Transcript_70332:12-797(-)
MRSAACSASRGGSCGASAPGTWCCSGAARPRRWRASGGAALRSGPCSRSSRPWTRRPSSWRARRRPPSARARPRPRSCRRRRASCSSGARPWPRWRLPVRRSKTASASPWTAPRNSRICSQDRRTRPAPARPSQPGARRPCRPRHGTPSASLWAPRGWQLPLASNCLSRCPSPAGRRCASFAPFRTPRHRSRLLAWSCTTCAPRRLRCGRLGCWPCAQRTRHCTPSPCQCCRARPRTCRTDRCWPAGHRWLRPPRRRPRRP